MALWQKLKRFTRRARAFTNMRPLIGERWRGASGRKRQITIRGRKFVIKPHHSQRELDGRQEVINFLKKNGNSFAAPNIPGGKFIVKVSKRYVRKEYGKRIEPYYNAPTLVEAMNYPYLPTADKKLVIALAAKTGISTKKLQEIAMGIYDVFFDKISEVRAYPNSRDILLDYENGLYTIRVVDF